MLSDKIILLFENRLRSHIVRYWYNKDDAHFLRIMKSLNTSCEECMEIKKILINAKVLKEYIKHG
jgi:hypothetical protein